jgi:uncharacterized protein YecT (DUF1311 family)
MKKIIIIIFLLLPLFTLAQSKEEHPIDSILTVCLDSNQSTQGMISCLQTAQESWDKELNKYYELLINVLSDEEKTALRSSQKKWLDYRNAESEFSGLMHTKMEGTMYLIFHADRAMDIVKKRALELKDYYTTKTEGN